MLKFKMDDSCRLVRLDKDIIGAGSQNVEAEFILPEDLGEVYAYWSTYGIEPYRVKIVEGRCIVPWEVLTKQLNDFGARYDHYVHLSVMDAAHRVSAKFEIPVMGSAWSDNPSNATPPTPEEIDVFKEEMKIYISDTIEAEIPDISGKADKAYVDSKVSDYIPRTQLMDAGIKSVSWTKNVEGSFTTVEDPKKAQRPRGTNLRYWVEIPSCPYFYHSKMYRVTFNGVVYDNLECRYGLLDDENKGSVIGSDTSIGGAWQMIGNRYLYDSRYIDTGEPFAILYVEHGGFHDGGPYYYSSTVGHGILMTRSAQSVTLKIETASITKTDLPHALDEDFGAGDKLLETTNSTYPRSSWGQGNISGRGSFAIGNSNISTGQFAFAEGFVNTASGYASQASGWRNTASGTTAQARGYGNTSSAYSSFAEGYGTTASGQASHAEGYESIASANEAHAEGDRTTASGVASHAEGYNTVASGLISHAEGADTLASAAQSHAEGSNTRATGLYSHAEGYATKAASKNQHVQGVYNLEDTEEKYAHIVGNGTWDNRSNAHTLDWNGNAWFAGDVSVGADNEVLAKKSEVLAKPSSGIEVGKYFRVASIDELGNPVLEAVDLPLDDYVKFTDYMKTDKAGVVKADTSNYGVSATSDGRLFTSVRSSAEYAALNDRAFLGKGTLENIKTDLVGRALADASASAYTDEQKAAALARLGGVSDVKIAGTSIINGGVADIPIAEQGSAATSKFGVTRFNDGYGIKVHAIEKFAQINKASNSAIDSRTSLYQPIVPNNLPYAVKSAMSAPVSNTDPVWTEEEQKRARERIGLEKEWDLKGTLFGDAVNRGNIDTGVTVDLSGCTELFVVGSVDVTSGSFRINIFNDENLIFAYYSTGSAVKKMKLHAIDTVRGYEFLSARYGSSETNYYTQSNFSSIYDRIDGKKISGMSSFYFDAPGAVNSCDIQIYAR